MHIGGSDLHAVNQACSGIHAYVGLGSEMPAAVLLRAGHLRVAGLLRIARGLGRLVDGGIHYRPAMHYQAVLLHLRVHKGKQLAAKTVVGHQLAEVAQNGGIGNAG